MPKAIQDYYDECAKVCYGCGSLNQQGLQLKSYWDGKVCNASFDAKEKYNGWPGFVYGGLIASLMDCHSMATASIDYKDRHPDLDEMPRFLTGSLKVDYRKPTPLGEHPLELKATVVSGSERKSTIAIELFVDGELTAQGEVIAVLIPDGMA